MSIAPDEKYDWFRIIVDLCNFHGYTFKTIAAAIHSAASTVQGWKDGASPKYEDGERLIELWAQVTANKRETVHRIKRNSHLA